MESFQFANAKNHNVGGSIDEVLSLEPDELDIPTHWN